MTNKEIIAVVQAAEEGKVIDHKLKCWPGPFSEIKAGFKTAEFRKDDRGFLAGDKCLLQEWSPNSGNYTGREILIQVTCKTTGFGIPEGYAMLSFRRLT